MKTQDQNKVKGILGTIIIHILIVVALFYLALRTPLPLPEEEGVEVDLGYSIQGVGNVQPDQPEQLQTYTPPPPQNTEISAPVRTEILTQDTEDAPALPSTEKPKKKPIERPTERQIDRPRQEPAPQQPTEVVEPPKPQVNQRALFKGSTSGSENAGSEGNTGQEGDQGRPDGLRDVKRYDGQGGKGNGPSFSLGGRGAKFLKEPSRDFKEQGDIVVDIWVDRNGNVARAEISVRGTTIVDQKMRGEAINAALNSIFTQDAQAAALQKGTITYTFIIKN